MDSALADAAPRVIRPKSIEVRTPQFVFPGLGPGIHERLLVDGRAKPGQDVCSVGHTDGVPHPLIAGAWWLPPVMVAVQFGCEAEPVVEGARRRIARLDLQADAVRALI